MTRDNEFQQIFCQLKAILVPYASGLDLEKDTADNYYLNTRFILKNKSPLFFASVKIAKNYVSFHLMPVYMTPELLNDISPVLSRRMQGKSCFNFKKVDINLFKKLDVLVSAGYLQYQKKGYV